MNVVLCGMPLSGKLETIKSLSRLTNTSCIDYSKYLLSPMIKLDVDTRIHSVPKITLLSTSGAVFYKQQVFSALLSKADIICYIFSIDISGNSNDMQISTFNEYLAVAKILYKTWIHIPWIFVLSNNDLGYTNHFQDYINEITSKNIDFIRICSIKDQGISELWNRIMQCSQQLRGFHLVE